jgi:hypothetical protein
MPTHPTIDAIVSETGRSAAYEPSQMRGDATALLGRAESGDSVRSGASASNDSADPDKIKVSISALHRRTIALQLSVGGRDQLLLGRGVYEQDPKLGSILRIECPPDARCEFLIIETSWNGAIQRGEAHGCDFLIRVG